jgi:parallel beta-helix repeat protein
MSVRLNKIIILVLATSFIVGCSPTSTPLPPPAPTPSWSSTDTVYMEANGNGDYSTIDEAIANAPSGATIVLDPGRYVIEETLLIDKSLKLLGAGMDETEITGSGLVMKISSFGNNPIYPVYIEGITFRKTGQESSSVVMVHDPFAEVVFHRVRFAGAKGVISEGSIVAGLSITYSGQVVVNNCEATDNDSAGILVYHGDNTRIENNTISDTHSVGNNDGKGIQIYQNSDVTVLQNQIINNWIGIFVQTSAPILEQNRLEGNEIDIVFIKSSDGIARENHCSAEYKYQILVYDDSNPVLEDNKCHVTYK